MKKTTIILLVLICFNIQAQSKKADELYKKGIEFFKDNQYQNARDAFVQSFELYPSFNAFGMYVLNTYGVEVNGLTHDNKTSKTLPFILKLKEVNKIKNSYFFNILNKMYLNTKNLKLNRFDNDDFKKINKSIDEIYHKNPLDYTANLNKVLSLFSRPQLYTKTIEHNRILFQEKEPVGGFPCIISYTLETHCYESVDCFNNLIKIKSDSEVGYLFRVIFNTLHTNGVFKDAINDLKTVLKLNPYNIYANDELSRILKYSKDYSGEIYYLNKIFTTLPSQSIESIKIDGSELDMLYLNVIFYLHICDEVNTNVIDGEESHYKIIKLLSEKKYGEVIKVCDKIIFKIEKEIWKDEETYYFRGISNFNLNKYENALSDFNHIIEKDSTIADAYAMRGAVKISLNDLKGALIDINKAIELDNSDGYMYYYRGLTQNKLGDITGACSDFKKAIELGYEEASISLKEISK